MSRPEASLEHLPTHVLFADISDDIVPEQSAGVPAETYLEQLKQFYSDRFQGDILEGLWELAGLADLTVRDQHQLDDPQEVERLFDKLDDMRLAFTVFGAEYAGRAGRLLLKHSRGDVERAELPTSLLIANPKHIPKTAPVALTRDYEQFTTYLESLLGLSTSKTSNEVEKILDGFRKNRFTYRPSDLFVSYLTIAAGLPDANIPDSVGTLIYDSRHRTSAEAT